MWRFIIDNLRTLEDVTKIEYSIELAVRCMFWSMKLKIIQRPLSLINSICTVCSLTKPFSFDMLSLHERGETVSADVDKGVYSW